jgi:hypothetical protein
MLERLTIDTFSPLLGDAFTLHVDPTRTMATELTQVTDLPQQAADASGGPPDSLFDRVPKRVERGAAAGHLSPGACQPEQLRALSGDYWSRRRWDALRGRVHLSVGGPHHQQVDALVGDLLETKPCIQAQDRVHALHMDADAFATISRLREQLANQP